MTRRCPTIGLTASAVHKKDGHGTRFWVRQPYVDAVIEAGGAPLVIPARYELDSLHAAYEQLEGLLLPGGADVAPERYGEVRLPELGGVDDALDQVELALARWALEDDLPILAICRGIQVLNVAAGGSLYQDIRTQIPATLDHRWYKGEPRDLLKHTISIDEGSRLASVAGEAPLVVNSLHHQSVRRVANGFLVTAKAPDGVVEAIESPSHRFVLGVQFHPEDLYGTEPRVAALFRAFVTAAKSSGS